VRSLATINTTVGHPAQGPALSTLQVAVAQSAQFPVGYPLQPLLQRKLLEGLTPCRQVLLIALLRTSCTPWSTLPRGPRPSEAGSEPSSGLHFGHLWWHDSGIPATGTPRIISVSSALRGRMGSTCRLLVATMLMAYSSRSSRNPAKARALLKAGNCP
jgi:hypothetical protein